MIPFFKVLHFSRTQHFKSQELQTVPDVLGLDGGVHGVGPGHQLRAEAPRIGEGLGVLIPRPPEALASGVGLADQEGDCIVTPAVNYG